MGRATVPAAVGGRGRGESISVRTRILCVDRHRKPESAEKVEDSRRYTSRNGGRRNRINGAVNVILKGGHRIEVGVADVLYTDRMGITAIPSGVSGAPASSTACPIPWDGTPARRERDSISNTAHHREDHKEGRGCTRERAQTDGDRAAIYVRWYRGDP